VILQQLYYDLDVVVIVLDGDDSHDVGGVFSVWVLTVLVGQHQTRVSFFHLYRRTTLKYYIYELVLSSLKQ